LINDAASFFVGENKGATSAFEFYEISHKIKSRGLRRINA
jgi:hypothetical protein